MYMTCVCVLYTSIIHVYSYSIKLIKINIHVAGNFHGWKISRIGEYMYIAFRGENFQLGVWAGPYYVKTHFRGRRLYRKLDNVFTHEGSGCTVLAIIQFKLKNALYKCTLYLLREYWVSLFYRNETDSRYLWPLNVDSCSNPNLCTLDEFKQWAILNTCRYIVYTHMMYMYIHMSWYSGVVKIEGETRKLVVHTVYYL